MKVGEKMDPLTEAYTAGALVSLLTYGVLKIIWKYAIKGELTG